MPNKELFNQTLKTTIALTDRIAVGIPGQGGADNILFSDYLRQTGTALMQRYSLTDVSQVFTVPANTIIKSIIAFTLSSNVHIKVSYLTDGDIIEDTEFTGYLFTGINKYFYTQADITIVITGTAILAIEYQKNII